MSDEAAQLKVRLRRIRSGAVLVVLAFSLLVPWSGCNRPSESRSGKNGENMLSQEIRRSVLAGSWYPSHPDTLSSVVDDYLNKVPEEKIEGRLLAVIVPHAGYRFSGFVAAYAHALLRCPEIRTVVLLGPSHRHSFRGFSVYATGGYETPLGIVPINADLAERLTSTDGLVSYIPEAHRAEHSIEIQLPFLQRMLGNFDCVPVVVGPHCTFDDCTRLAESLVGLLRHRKDVVLVASSDMSHFPAYDDAQRVDREMLAAVESFDLERIVRTDTRMRRMGVPNLSCTFCGLEAVLVTLMAARGLGADAVKVLKYANSGDTPFGDRNRVVGYGAVAVYASDEKDGRIEFAPLDRDAQQVLLDLARGAIETYLRTGRTPEYEPVLPVLNEKRGVFVTITKHGQLRGCIGYHGNDVPLYQLVPDRAIAAAVRDSRFPPLAPDELDEIEIKISVYLTNVYRIENADEFELGKQGIILRKGERAATFLPEVPLEAGWSKEEEMEHLCRKAGLPPGAWKEEAELYVYSTQVFGEK